MEKLIIFTIYNGLEITQDDGRRTKNGINLIQTCEFLALKNNETVSFAQAKSITDGNVFLIQDTIDREKLVSFLDNFDLNEVAVLHHSLPSKDILKMFRLLLNSMHEPGTAYDKMLDIISDAQANKFERLKAEIFKFNYKLNAALEFLHNCLGGATSTDKLKLTNAGFELDKKKNDKPSINELIKKLSNGNDYNAALREVRDELLEKAGVK